MSNVIDFLESLARDIGVGATASADYQARVAALDVEASMRNALESADSAAVAQLLGGRDSMMMVLALPDSPDVEESSMEMAEAA